MAFIQILLTFLSSWKFVLLFYIILGIIVYIHRKKFALESGFILLYRTDFGIRFINKIADKYGEFLKVVGYSAIGIGFAGMITICVLLLKGLYEMIFVPAAPPTLSLVIPGVQIPGSPIFIPFWYGIIALFIVVVFHEFGHGIIARSHGLKIKHTGFGFMGPLPLAFVEPDETEVVKKPSVVQHSIFAAGPFFNVILTVLVLVILSLMIIPLSSMMSHNSGVEFQTIQKGYAAEEYGLKKDLAYTSLNGIRTNNTDDFVLELNKFKPNDTIILTDIKDNHVSVVLGFNPKNVSQPYLGVIGIQDYYLPNNLAWWYAGTYYLLYFLKNLLIWIEILSLGIGLANLLPIGPVDGGRMVGKALIDTNGKKKGMKIWAAITVITIGVMLVLILVPIIKNVFFKV